MKPLRYLDVFEPVLVIGAPLALAILELFHPQPHDLFHLDLHTWLLVHYLQIPLFPLCALATVFLLRGQSGLVATVCRVAMFVFAVSYVAFDTAAGVVTAVLVQAAQTSSTPDLWRAAVAAIWTHPVIGGAATASPLLAIVGGVAWSVGNVAAAVVIRRAGGSWIPVLLLVVSAAGLGVFQTHAWPGGPLTFGALAAAAAWLQWEHNSHARTGLPSAA